MDRSKVIKVFGLTATVIGFAGTILSNWVSDQKMDQRIDEKVAKAISELGK